VTEVVLLAPCLHIIPTEHFGFRDHESRFRQRLIMNEKSRNVFITWAEIVNYIRQFFDSRNFIEVETP
jgi:lysyl-tRNA synthetase, class II